MMGRVARIDIRGDFFQRKAARITARGLLARLKFWITASLTAIWRSQGAGVP